MTERNNRNNMIRSGMTRARAVCLAAAGLMLLAGAAGAADHTPAFRWVAGGETGGPGMQVYYDNTLYDGNEPIGYFDKATLGFYDYRLIPGVVCGNAKRYTYGISLYAQNQYWGAEARNVKEFKVETEDPTRFVMRVKLGQKHTSEKDDALAIEAALEVTWDKQLQCYAWTVTKKMTVLGGKTLTEKFVEFEDTYFSLHGAGNQLYQYFVRKSPGDRYYKMPFNNNKESDKYNWYYGTNGFWVACLSKTMNPALEWLEGYGPDMKTEICWAFLDLHSYWLAPPDGFKAGNAKTVRYRFVSYPYDKAKAILDQSTYRDDPDDPRTDFVKLEWPLTKFEKNIHRATTLGMVSFWPSDTNAVWDKTCGYDDTFSLKLDVRDGKFRYFHCLGADWPPHAPDKGTVRLRFMAKAKDLTGYARLVYKYRDAYNPRIESPKITGTHDWKEYVLEVPEGWPCDPHARDLSFEANGPGEVWIDNLSRESDATLRRGLYAGKLGIQNDHLWVTMGYAGDGHRIVMNLWNSNSNFWKMECTAGVGGVGRLAGQYPGLTFEPPRTGVTNDLAQLDVKMLSQKTKPDYLTMRISLHKDAHGALMEVTDSNVPESKGTGTWGLGIQTHRTPYAGYYGLDNPERAALWKGEVFKGQGTHYESMDGPAVGMLLHTDEGWAMYQVYPETSKNTAVFAEGGCGRFDGGAAPWTIIGGLSFKPGLSAEAARDLIRKTVDRDLKLYGKTK